MKYEAILVMHARLRRLIFLGFLHPAHRRIGRGNRRDCGDLARHSAFRFFEAMRFVIALWRHSPLIRLEPSVAAYNITYMLYTNKWFDSTIYPPYSRLRPLKWSLFANTCTNMNLTLLSKFYQLMKSIYLM